ncbi:hypothetical protein [Coleofasciculus sp. G2-EDA-02]
MPLNLSQLGISTKADERAGSDICHAKERSRSVMATLKTNGTNIHH